MHAENTQNQYTPVEGGLKGWKSRVSAFGVSEQNTEALKLPIELKIQEATKIMASGHNIEELAWLWEQKNDFKVKKDQDYKSIAKVFTDYEQVAASPIESQESAESVLNFALTYKLNTPQLREAVTFISDHQSKRVSIEQLEQYVRGVNPLNDAELAKTFGENKSFIENFVKSYQTWFVQPLTQIQGNALEEGLDKFREIGIEFVHAERLEALNTIKDLLTNIAKILVDSNEDVPTAQVFEVIRDVTSKPTKLFKEGNMKKLEGWFEGIAEQSPIANITDS